MSKWFESITKSSKDRDQKRIDEILRIQKLELDFAKKLEEIGVPQWLKNNNKDQKGNSIFPFLYPEFNGCISPSDRGANKYPNHVLGRFIRSSEDGSIGGAGNPSKEAENLVRKLAKELQLQDHGLKVGFNSYHDCYAIVPADHHYSWWTWL